MSDMFPFTCPACAIEVGVLRLQQGRQPATPADYAAHGIALGLLNTLTKKAREMLGSACERHASIMINTFCESATASNHDPQALMLGVGVEVEPAAKETTH